MRVAIPHNLPREEVRRRLRGGSGDIARHIPGSMAEVHTHWQSEDQMGLSVAALGTTVNGHVEIEDRQVVFQVALPPALSFVEPLVAGALRKGGAKLLAGPSPGPGSSSPPPKDGGDL